MEAGHFDSRSSESTRLMDAEVFSGTSLFSEEQKVKMFSGNGQAEEAKSVWKMAVKISIPSSGQSFSEPRRVPKKPETSLWMASERRWAIWNDDGYHPISIAKKDGLLGGLAEEGVAAGARIPFRGGI